MPRKRPAGRLDEIVEAATVVFIRYGFGPAKVAEIARVARVGPGTVYLYAEGKDALLDLALRRAFEDPALLGLVLPHRSEPRSTTADNLWRCIQNAAHFPRLWLASDSAAPERLESEVAGIIGELYAWLARYRRGIRLIERTAGDWPELAQLFHRRFWRGGVRRLAGYLERRREEGALPARGQTLAAAHLVVESLAWMAVHRHWAPDPPAVSEQEALDTSVRLLTSALLS